MQQLSPCATTIEPVLDGLVAVTTEPSRPTDYRLCSATGEATAMRKPVTAARGQPLLAAAREKPVQQQRSSTGKNNKNIIVKKESARRPAVWGPRRSLSVCPPPQRLHAPGDGLDMKSKVSTFGTLMARSCSITLARLHLQDGDTGGSEGHLTPQPARQSHSLRSGS